MFKNNPIVFKVANSPGEGDVYTTVKDSPVYECICLIIILTKSRCRILCLSNPVQIFIFGFTECDFNITQSEIKNPFHVQEFSDILLLYCKYVGYAAVQFVEAQRYKAKGRGFVSR